MKRALISVYNKQGIIEFSEKLIALGWEIISTGGTYKELKQANIPVTEINEITKFPEILDGRVKTLNPILHGGILFRRDNEKDLETVNKYGLCEIDMVVNNFYPFEETIKKDGITEEQVIENIDIGGPSMLRAASKNFKFVTVIFDNEDYNTVIDEIARFGDTTLETRKILAGKAYSYTAYYDSLVSDYFNSTNSVLFPKHLTMGYKKNSDLRYGENPHQKAALYEKNMRNKPNIVNANKLHGKELSYNNIFDANALLELLTEFNEPTAVAIKHGNPCGISSSHDIYTAYLNAYNADTDSIFGGIVGLNREVDEKLASKLSEIFLEIILAPSFTSKALEILEKKKNIRLLEIDKLNEFKKDKMTFKAINGGLLYQEKDNLLINGKLEVVSKRKPTPGELEDMNFAWIISKYINSNGVVLAKDKTSLGIGLGDVNRYFAVESALKKAKGNTENSVLASDGFFPFDDSIKLLAKYGITAIIEPGGSIRDKEVIEQADKNNIALVFTGIRHFKH